MSELAIEHKNGRFSICKKDTSDLVFIKGNWGHCNEPIDLDNSDFPDDGHVNDSRACVLSCFDGDLENEIGDDLMRQVDKVFTKIPTMNIENSQRIADSSFEIVFTMTAVTHRLLVHTKEIFPLTISVTICKTNAFLLRQQNTMAATSGTGTAYPSGAPEFTPGF